MRPSRRATATLSTVRSTRKPECSSTSSVSFERSDGKATRVRSARSWRRNAASMFGLDVVVEGRRGKCAASAASVAAGVGRMGTWGRGEW